ncbi:MAG: discoidin domain-containing protein, partial [Sedimentisphaerales bacterium]|nr:discoidin domain-containing protein [Sedimentisphaerales bacterium]
MYKKIFCLISFAFMIAASNDASADLVAHWKLDDGSGTIAKDFVGENDGTLIGDTAWAAGKLGGALRFDGNGDYVNCGNNSVFNPTGSFSIAFWANITQWTTAWAEAFLGKGGDNDRGGWCVRRGSGTSLCFTVAGVNSGTGGWFGNAAPAQNEWIHIACVYDQAGGTAAIYINGVLDSSFTVSGNAATNNAPLLLGTRGNTAGTGPDTWGSSYYGGMLDDVRFYNHALSAVEVAGSMIGISPGFAANPLPKTDAVDIVRDQILSWTPGKFANTHDVYFGTDFEDVNQATLSNNLGVTVTEGLDVNSYDPGILDFGMTYYWRVDEVNAPPSNTVFKGTVWSFTIEPYSYQIPAENITASSLGSSEDSDPNQTINESGLDLNNMDLHSKITGDMWISTDDVNDIWIRYDFDKVYKLHEMLVWNYNLGFYLNAGFKAVTVEYSGDGQTWTALADVPEFAKGTGKDSYLYNTVVDFNGVTAQSVRLTANSNWSDGAIPNVGLSEVRFMYIPVWAREPYPEDEASDIPLDVTLSWRAGREAAEHKVYLSQDEQSVAD